MSSTLEMIFLTDANKKVTLRLPEPKEDLTMDKVETVMNKIITNNIFEYSGASLTEIVNAQIRTVEDVPEY